VFGDVIFGALDGDLKCGDFWVLPDVGNTQGNQILKSGLLFEDLERKGLESALFRDLSAGALLGFEGKIEVFKFCFNFAGLDSGFQRRRQLALLMDGLENGFFPLGKSDKILKAVADIANLDFIKTACGLLGGSAR